MSYTADTLSLADLTSSACRRTEAETRECRFCEQPFEPRQNARAQRQWCYEPDCEELREKEHSQQIMAAARRRRKNGR